MKKYYKIVLAPIIGYLTYLFSRYLLRFIFPILHTNSFEYKIEVLFSEYYFLLFCFISVLIFQYKFIIPNTNYSIKNTSLIFIIIGFVSSLLISLLDYSSDNLSFSDSIIQFLIIFVKFESFWFGNLLTIKFLDKKKKRKKRRKRRVVKNE